MPYNVDEEIELLSGHIKRLGKEEGEGYQVTFKVVCKMIWATYNKIINPGAVCWWPGCQYTGVPRRNTQSCKEKGSGQLRSWTSFTGIATFLCLCALRLVCLEMCILYIKYIILPLSNTVPVFIILYSLQGMSDSVIITLKKWYLKMCFYVSLHCVL